jgi:ElaB/YqjD/DUF883 family membrane-anchored ribosome-binding protein
MSGKEKLERDCQELIQEVEKMAEDALSEVKEKARKIKSEAEVIGESVERTINDAEGDVEDKKS